MSLSCRNPFRFRSLPKRPGGRWPSNNRCARGLLAYSGGMARSRTILIVEDEPLIAMMLEDFLESLGHSISASCDSVAAALSEVEKGGFDLAILDVNLKGHNVWPVAARLREQGVPFVIASGGHVDPPPAEFASVPLIEKPYTVDRVTPAIDAAFAG